jgi:NADPH-dependent glutamate synthase beta subunit-like oxidoreductase/Pyruvate/2-oxoacid:ferredoxin oxidoreductase delta subunit
MALFKTVKKPLIQQAGSTETQSSPLRPHYTPKTAPCSAGCPIGCDVRGMFATLADAEADGRTAEQAAELAWRRITSRNPFPSVCGRLCSHPCADNCHRSLKEGALAVNAVERFVGDYAIEHGLQFSRTKELSTSVAVVGAGLAGLTAAYHLAKRGYKVTIFESSAQPGGIVRQNLPDDTLGSEIGRILALGVELKCESGAIDGEALRAAHGAVVETAGMETPDASVIAYAIAKGLSAAEEADARIRGVVAAPKPALKPSLKERIRLEWYKEQPGYAGADGMTAAEALGESRRCLSCGMCMGCGNCWMYCTKHGFEKVPSGRRYRLNLDRCNGCGKCADGCPSGYIDMA